MSLDYLPDPELPEGSMVTATLLIVSYLNSEGQMAYSVATKGQMPLSSYLGLTVMAQQHLLAWPLEGG